MKIMFDIIIKNGFIIDGTGNPWYKADMAIKNGKIIKIGNIKESGNKIINARGLIVSPGFIDPHTHNEYVLFTDPRAENYIYQGVTTIGIGSCGLSAAPISKKYKKELSKYMAPLCMGTNISWNWESFSEFLHKLEEKGLGINIVPFVRHNTIRITVMGFSNKKANKSEMKKMVKLLEESLKGGAGNATMLLGIYTWLMSFEWFTPGYASAIGIVMTILLFIYVIIFVKVTKIRVGG